MAAITWPPQSVVSRVYAVHTHTYTHIYTFMPVSFNSLLTGWSLFLIALAQLNSFLSK